MILIVKKMANKKCYCENNTYNNTNNTILLWDVIPNLYYDNQNFLYYLKKILNKSLYILNEI